MDVTQVLATAQRVLAADPYGFLTTWTDAGPSVRLVQHLRVDDDFGIVFATERGTRKERQIAVNPRVVYSVSDTATRSAVSLYGKAALDDDPDHRRTLWTPEFLQYFPDSPVGPNFVFISITPDRLEVWSRDDKILPDPVGRSSAVLTRTDAGWTGPTGTHPSNV